MNNRVQRDCTTNQAMYKAVCEQLSKMEDYPSIIKEITYAEALEYWETRKYDHHVSMSYHVWFISSDGLPIRFSRNRVKGTTQAHIMSYDNFRNNRKEPVNSSISLIDADGRGE